MSKIQAVLDEFMPCGGTVCPGCEVACKYVDGRTPDADRMADAIIDLRAERDALRTVDDAMVERAARATMTRVAEESDLFADDEEALRIHREYARIALTAALAVQPTTGDTP